MRPAGFEEGVRYPVLLNIHGGPFTQYTTRFFDEFHVLAGAGYAVVYCNPRGSSGYSEEWGRAIRGPDGGGPGWGSVDYDDLMAVTDEALSRFSFCDPDRVGVLGGSYGGYMTSWIVGHTDRFKAACSERAVNNMIAEGGSSDIGIWFKGYTGTHWFEDPETHLTAVALQLCAEHHDAAPDRPLRGRPALPGRQRRGAVHHPAHPRARGRVRPVPGGRDTSSPARASRATACSASRS